MTHTPFVSNPCPATAIVFVFQNLFYGQLPQAQVLRDAGGHTEELQKQRSRFTQNSEDEIRAIFEDAGLLSYAADAQVFQATGIRATPLRQSPRMIEILADSYRRTNADICNFTRTTAIQSTQAPERRLRPVLRIKQSQAAGRALADGRLPSVDGREKAGFSRSGGE